MNAFFVLSGITGRALFNRFAEAIKEEDVGWDYLSSASLSEDGLEWSTAFPGFKYKILNPDSAEDQAIVEYTGACRGFLSQNLIPSELGGETLSVTIFDGSAIEKHKDVQFTGVDAGELFEVYGLMQKASPRKGQMAACLAAVRACKLIRKYMKEEGIESSTTFVYSSSREDDDTSSCGYKGDPEIGVVFTLIGRQISYNFHLNQWGKEWGDESTKDFLVEEVTSWLGKLKKAGVLC